MVLPAWMLRPRADSRAEFSHNPRNLVLVFDTSLEPANNTISVPVQGAAPNCTIDWGDGTRETHTTTGFKTKTYANPGVYVVQISGTMRTLQFGGGASSTNNKLKLVRCLSFGEIGITSLNSGFGNCPNLIQCPASLPRESSVTTLAACFSGCSGFNDARIAGWNTAAVTGMNGVFQNATAFNAPIGSWNTASVSNMFSAFAGAAAFNAPIGSWNTGSVTSMQSMFSGASAFNQDISGWNTASVTNLTAAFLNATAFNQPIGGWNTAAVTAMDTMFNGATAFNQPIGNWNVANVSSMSGMFGGTGHAFAQDISGWNIRKVTGMAGMFSGNNWGTANYDAALTAWADLSDDDLRSQAITAFATLSAGTQTRVTSNGHGMVAGSRVNISGTTNYDGDYNVVAAATNTFDIAKAFVANDATGTMKHRRSRNVTAGFGSNKYSTGTATTKRGVLTGTYSWTITDGGQV
jgi:surface protein